MTAGKLRNQTALMIRSDYSSVVLDFAHFDNCFHSQFEQHRCTLLLLRFSRERT